MRLSFHAALNCQQLTIRSSAIHPFVLVTCDASSFASLSQKTSLITHGLILGKQALRPAASRAHRRFAIPYVLALPASDHRRARGWRRFNSAEFTTAGFCTGSANTHPKDRRGIRPNLYDHFDSAGSDRSSACYHEPIAFDRHHHHGTRHAVRRVFRNGEFTRRADSRSSRAITQNASRRSTDAIAILKPAWRERAVEASHADGRHEAERRRGAVRPPLA